jgi:mycoredoxin
MARHGIAYTEINIDHDVEAREVVKRINQGNRSVPTIVFPSGAVLVEPSAPELEAQLVREGMISG